MWPKTSYCKVVELVWKETKKVGVIGLVKLF